MTQGGALTLVVRRFSGMFSIRVFTPAVLNEDGWQHAGGELIVGSGRLCFLVDLTYWPIAAYQRQWRDGVSRLVQGAPSTALMTAFRGPGESAHAMWALWREEGHVYVQEHSVLPADLDVPFDPNEPYPYVGARIPASECALPIPEWRVELSHVQSALLGLRLPKLPE
jgi:contact-dependent growth inhibition (CDI) system CdiI-like immunity protein